MTELLDFVRRNCQRSINRETQKLIEKGVEEDHAYYSALVFHAARKIRKCERMKRKRHKKENNT